MRNDRDTKVAARHIINRLKQVEPFPALQMGTLRHWSSRWLALQTPLWTPTHPDRNVHEWFADSFSHLSTLTALSNSSGRDDPTHGVTSQP